MRSAYVGIDPGAKGAIAVYDGVRLKVYDMPTVQIQRGMRRDKKTKKMVPKIVNHVSAYMVGSIFRRLKNKYGDRIYVCLEKVGAMPQQGVTSMFTFGRNLGLLEGAIGAMQIPVELVPPRTWQKAMRVFAGKDSARHRAMALYPEHTDLFKRKMDDGRADAALMARYWKRNREK